MPLPESSGVRRPSRRPHSIRQDDDTMARYGDLTLWYDSHQELGDPPEAWQGRRGIVQFHCDWHLDRYAPDASCGDVCERVR